MALIDKASLLMVPSTYEDGTLYNVLPSGNKAPDETGNHNGYDQTRADFTFSRGSNLAATRVNSDGLIEKGRENVMTYSNGFDNWTNDDTTETSGQEGYDGTNDAWKLVGNTNASRHMIFRSVSFSGVGTFSLYVKASGHNYAQIASAQTTAEYANFDLSDGSIGNVGSKFIDAKATSVGNGWYRLSVVTTSGANTFYIALISSKTAGWLESWTMDNATDGILIQDAQLEKGLVSTPYIATGSTTAQAGILEDMPRINYDANGENGALLLESSRTNLLPQSEYFGASWFASNINVDTNAETSPQGVQNATTIENTSASNYLVYSASVTASTKYIFSFYVKNIDATAVNVIFYDSTNSAVISTTAYEDDLTTDWKRLDFEVTTPAGCVTLNVNLANGLSGSMNIWGAQLEAGSYPSSLIPTHGAAVTRGADSCSVTGVSDVIGQTEGTIYGEFIRTKTNDTYSPVIVLMENSTAELIEIYAGPNSNTFGVVIIDGGVNQFSKSFTAPEGVNKFALAYKQNDCALYHNGVQIGTDTSATIPTLTQMTLGRFTYTSNFQLGDSIKKAVLFNERLTNEELATLTTL